MGFPVSSLLTRASPAQVRGPQYLSDKRKVEAEGVEMELLSVDLVDVAPTFHISRHLPAVQQSSAPFMFVMQVRLVSGPADEAMSEVCRAF